MATTHCPHCDLETEVGPIEVQSSCPFCLRAFGVCPRCHEAVRLYDYWRKPGILPPLPPEREARKITFAVEEHQRFGDYATFDEAGHSVVLWHDGRTLEWRRCPK